MENIKEEILKEFAKLAKMDKLIDYEHFTGRPTYHFAYETAMEFVDKTFDKALSARNEDLKNGLINEIIKLRHSLSENEVIDDSVKITLCNALLDKVCYEIRKVFGDYKKDDLINSMK